MKPIRAALLLLAAAIALPTAAAVPWSSPLVPESGAANTPSGVLELKVTPDPRVDSFPAREVPAAEAYVFIDGIGLSPAPSYRLRAGAHRLEVRRFGYHDYGREIVVEAGRTLRIEVALVERPFSLLYFGASPDSFSPLEPVRDFGFRVDLAAPGDATVEVIGGDGAALWRGKARVDSLYFFLSWDGRDSAGNPLPVGKYRARLSASDSRQQEADVAAECAFEVRPPRRFSTLGAAEGLAGTAALPIFLPRSDGGFAAESGTTLGATLLLAPSGAYAGVALDTGLFDGSDLITGSARLAFTPTATTYESWSGINFEPFYLAWKTMTTDFSSYFYVFTDWRLGASFTLDTGSAVFSLGPELWFGDVPAPALELRAGASFLLPLGAGSHFLIAGRVASPELLTAGFGGQWRAEAAAEISVRLSAGEDIAFTARADIAPAFALRELSIGLRTPF